MLDIPALTFLLKNWRTLALSCAALLLAGFLFYAWSYNRGESACESRHAAAALALTEKNADANADAAAREIKAVERRTEARTRILTDVEKSHEENDDSPAPVIVQRAFDGLRAVVDAEGGKAR